MFRFIDKCHYFCWMIKMISSPVIGRVGGTDPPPTTFDSSGGIWRDGWSVTCFATFFCRPTSYCVCSRFQSTVKFGKSKTESNTKSSFKFIKHNKWQNHLIPFSILNASIIYLFVEVGYFYNFSLLKLCFGLHNLFIFVTQLLKLKGWTFLLFIKISNIICYFWIQYYNDKRYRLCNIIKEG